MIFLTVGAQLPFDRLTRAVDDAAPDLGEPVFGQIGATGYVPRHFRWAASLVGSEFERLVAECRVMVAHAGTGSILAAQRHGKPIVVFPRRVSHGEVRSDHQVSSCERFRAKRGLYVLESLAELPALLRRTDLEAMTTEADTANRDLFVARLRESLAGPLRASRRRT